MVTLTLQHRHMNLTPRFGLQEGEARETSYFKEEHCSQDAFDLPTECMVLASKVIIYIE